MTVEMLNQARDKVQGQLLINFALTSSPDTIFLLRRIRYEKSGGQNTKVQSGSFERNSRVLYHP